jgi:hypothetical protein
MGTTRQEESLKKSQIWRVICSKPVIQTDDLFTPRSGKLRMGRLLLRRGLVWKVGNQTVGVPRRGNATIRKNILRNEHECNPSLPRKPEGSRLFSNKSEEGNLLG